MKKPISSLLLLSLVTINSCLFTTISCSNNKKEDEENKEDSDYYFNFNGSERIKNLLLEKDLELKQSSILISENYFNEYKNDIDEISKFFILDEKNSLNSFDFNLLSTPEIVQKENKNFLKLKISIFNILDPNEKLECDVNFFSFFFASDDQKYFENVYYDIINKFSLKSEYQNSRILDLFKQTTTNEEFANKFIDFSAILENVIGIKIKILIPTQNLSVDNPENNFLKLQIKMYDLKTNVEVTPSKTSQAAYLKVNQNQKDTFTIVDAIDLKETQIKSLNSFHYGELLIRKQNDSYDSKLEINYDFSGKFIINQIDLRNFDHIVFNSSFERNYIKEILFNPESIIENLNDYKFSNNLVQEIYLPSRIINYSVNCFDKETKVFGINNIESIKNIFNEENELRLDLLDNEEQIYNALDIITNINQSPKTLLNINKIYLPLNYDYQKKLNQYKVIADELIFVNKNNDDSVFNFYSDISKWSIGTIKIPNILIKINKSNLPLNSNITREFNEEIVKLVNNEVLEINKNIKMPFNDLNATNIFNELPSLDEYFYSFDSPKLKIKTIIFNDVNIQNISVSLNFFIEQQENKTIIFSSKTKKINEDFYTKIKELETSELIVKREMALEENIIWNQELKLNEFYKIYSSHSNINQFLVGYEDIIRTINTQNVETIFQETFKSLKGWENISITLDENIKLIKSQAFYNSSIKIIVNNFNPIEIAQGAFYNSSISGDLTLTNIEKLESSAFENTKFLKTISISNILSLENSVFRNSSIETIILDNVNVIENYAFYGSNIKNVVFNSNIETIGISSFSYTKNIETINLKNVKKIGDRAFYSSSITNILGVDNVLEIGSYAFANCPNLNNNFDFNNEVLIKDRIFENSPNIGEINNFNLEKFDFIKNLFGTNIQKIKNLNINLDNESIYQVINYNSETKVLDFSNFRNSDFETNTHFRNNLLLFVSRQMENDDLLINELILPNEETINTYYKDFFKGFTIKKLTWNWERLPIKTMQYQLSYYFGNVTIQSINEDFCVGMSLIPDYAFSTIRASDLEINLINIKEVGTNAFINFINTRYKNTESVTKIASYAFNKTSEFKIGLNVKLNEFSFSDPDVIGTNKISRNQIFGNSIFNKIYDQKTKILDFSKINDIHSPTDYLILEKYKDIGEYLLEGDVKTLILPNVYNITSNIYSNLGNIERIIFQPVNQIIFKDAFKNTIVKEKPSLSETKILLDLDNFFQTF